MNRRRQIILALGASALVSHLSSFAQPQSKVWRVGFLGASSVASYAGRLEALRMGLRELGYVEGKNIVIDYHWAEGNYERLPELAAGLVRLKVDAIVTGGAPATRIAKQATTTIPVVMGAISDPVGLGLVASLARPGGNITGSTYFQPELMAKRLELLKEIAPRTARAGVLLHAGNPANPLMLQAMEATARSLKVELHRFEVKGPDEFDSVFTEMARKRLDAMVVAEQSVFIVNARAFLDLTAKRRFLVIGFSAIAEAGGLLAYDADIPALWRRSAVYLDKIFHGAWPGDLPVERATRFELIVNLKTAKALGVKIPQSILIRADKVIE